MFIELKIKERIKSISEIDFDSEDESFLISEFGLNLTMLRELSLCEICVAINIPEIDMIRALLGFRWGEWYLYYDENSKMYNILEAV